MLEGTEHFLQIRRPFEGWRQSPFPISPIDQGLFCLCINKSFCAHREYIYVCVSTSDMSMFRAWCFSCTAEHQKWLHRYHQPRTVHAAILVVRSQPYLCGSLAVRLWLGLAKLQIGAQISRTFPKHVTEARSSVGCGVGIISIYHSNRNMVIPNVTKACLACLACLQQGRAWERAYM